MQKFALSTFALLVFSLNSASQTSTSGQYIPPEELSTPAQMARITRSVEMLSLTMKAFVDKWEKVGGLTLTEKQQRLVLGMELLTRAEQRVSTLQNAQIALTEKLNDARSKVTQIELELRPQSIERSTSFEGSTDTVERREARQQRLQAERQNLTTLAVQINSNLQEVSSSLRDAQALAYRLRRTFLPQIEQEIYGPNN